MSLDGILRYFLKIKLKKSKIAIIDIGSNSVRLVIYPDSGKYPYPLFNERINCRLGEKLFETGKLSTRSISRALKALQRFSIIIKNSKGKIFFIKINIRISLLINMCRYSLLEFMFQQIYLQHY